MKLTAEPGNIEFTFPLIAEETAEDLNGLHARAQTDYETWKQGLLEWLATEGKDPDRLRGYSEATLRATNYKVDQIMRWMWNKRGYTTEFTPEDADLLMKELARYTEYGDANLNTFVKVIKRLFRYQNEKKRRNVTWECRLDLNEPGVTNRDYFRKDEFQPLYEAALEHGTVRHYHSCTPGERDRIRGHLAQRFEMPKEQVGPDEFDRANSFKIPSLVSVALDCGLRPVEVGRAKVEWVNLDDATLNIPREESSKNENNWKCVLSEKSVRTLREWLREREGYEKYDGRDELWLNKVGNPYDTNSLNYLLRQLVEAAGIRPAGRDLTWYSIRHGVATVWAEEENIQDAREQLRHRRVDTTLGYAHSGVGTRLAKVNSKW